jgi:protein-L-isoaspartate O-methyltransferase
MRVLVVLAGTIVGVGGAWPSFAQTAPKGYSNKLAPYVASPARVMDRMLELANIKPGETLYDLGCGDGRILIAAVQKYKVNAVGVEISPRLAAKASASIRKAGLESKARVIHGDFADVDPSGADVVYLYLSTRANEQLRPRLEARLKAGARVVSHDYPIPGWKPTKVEETDGSQRHMIYLYEMPPAKQ